MPLQALESSSAFAQDLTGDWQGTLKVGATALRLVMHLSKDKKGGVRGAIDSIDQPGGIGMPITSVTFQPPDLQFTLDDIMAEYRGRMNLSGAIEGTWSQEHELPLTWERKILVPSKPLDPTAFAGTWAGDLEVGLMALYLILHIETQRGKLTATLDSPDQGGAAVPANATRIEDGYPTVKWESIRAVYHAKLDDDRDTLDGSFTQLGMHGALRLKRVYNDEELLRHRPQTPKKPYPYREEEVRYRNAQSVDVELAGTLTIPSGQGPFPAAILIAGSGNLDRDETMAGHKPFLVLADYLTQRGFAVLRADKRGVGESSGDSDDALTTDYASDVEAGIAYLRQRPEVDGQKIGLIGHSEGGVIAPIVAANDPGIAFLILLAGTGVPGEELAAEQEQSAMELGGIDSASAAAEAEATREIVAALNRSEGPVELKTELMARPDNAYSEARIDAIIDRFDPPWLRSVDRHPPARGAAQRDRAGSGDQRSEGPAGASRSESRRHSCGLAGRKEPSL
jgi:hypothetical protein